MSGSENGLGETRWVGRFGRAPGSSAMEGGAHVPVASCKFVEASLLPSSALGVADRAQQLLANVVEMPVAARKQDRPGRAALGDESRRMRESEESC